MGEFCKYDRLVLIGMPCSGKSSIGRSLASYYDYQFVDMDEEIEKKAGLTIPEIFEQKGEQAFRDLESDVTQEMLQCHRAVIATGGGIVTRPHNMEVLREGSFVLFLHRDFFKLATTPKHVMDKRPLLKQTSFENLLAMYKKRLPLYRQFCDVEISNDRNKEDAVAQAVRAIFQKSVEMK